MANFIQAAFDVVMPDAVLADEWFVSLVESIPYYGGPEEGGWWGRDTSLVAYRKYPSEELATAAAAAVEKLAAELRAEAQKTYGDHCRLELDWLEARGLDADFLPEPDGPSEFLVRVTHGQPVQESCGSRRYE